MVRGGGGWEGGGARSGVGGKRRGEGVGSRLGREVGGGVEKVEGECE